MLRSNPAFPSRSARCPCGSGLRYNVCCAPEAQSASESAGPAYPGWDSLSAGHQRQLRELLRQALLAQTAGRLEVAHDLYLQVLAQAPETFDALHMLGVICYLTGRLDEAHLHLRRALDLTDWRVRAMRHNLGLVIEAALAARAGGGTTPAPSTGPFEPMTLRTGRDETEAAAENDAAAGLTPGGRGRRVVPDRSGPLISVLVSTYNAAAWLPACLADLERQTIADATEIIVIDSGSKEDERAIARSFEGRFRNLVYLRTGRETLHAAWNRGIALARGRYVTNANTDDAHRADSLETMVTALEACPEADFAYCDYAWSSVPNDSFDAPHMTRTVRHDPYHPAQTLFYCIVGCHPMWRRTLFDELGGYDPDLVAVGDFDLVLRAVANGRRPVHVAEVLSLFYQNPRGLTFGSVHASREFAAIQSKHRARMPIERLFRIAPDDAGEVARAWSALGVVATSLPVPWLDVSHVDLEYAAYCFRQSLNADENHLPALSNLAAVFGSTNQWDLANALLARLPPDRAARLKDLIRQRRYVFEAAATPAAALPLQHPVAVCV